LHPLLLLAVYTVVFSVVLRVGEGRPGGRTTFALEMFAGMVVFSVFADTLSRAPTAITGRPNFVTKIVFPLLVLPAAELWASAYLAAFSGCVLIGATCLAHGGLPATALALPLVIPPLLLLTIGVAWLVAAIGVYVRDVAASIGLIVTVTMFMTPVFWRVADWPEALRCYVWLNPLALLIETVRGCLLLGEWPALLPMLAVYAVALVVAQLGFWCFQQARRGFADVL
jgi:lipopolysaccharide transport system permease protein